MSPSPEVLANCEFGALQHGYSLAAAGIFCALFALTFILHTWQMIATRSWFLTALVVGALVETAGFATRIINAMEERSENTNGVGCFTEAPLIVSTVCLLVAPAFMAASIYMILGRIMRLVDADKYSIIRRSWLTKIFVVGDILSLVVQTIGAGASIEYPDEGKNIVILGLIVQLIFFGLFIIVTAIFHARLKKGPTDRSLDPKVRWLRYLILLYVTSALILIRSIFRLIEYIQGMDGPLLTNEMYLYIFDSALMFIVFIYMNWFHPSEIGLLLRGRLGINHGLQLLKPGRDKVSRPMPQNMESLSSFDDRRDFGHNYA